VKKEIIRLLIILTGFWPTGTLQANAQYGPPGGEVPNGRPSLPQMEHNANSANHAMPAEGLPNKAQAEQSSEVNPEEFLIDNGLWDGEPIGPCCAICGGGSGCPPDWYTEQGVRLLGRTRPREIEIGYLYDGKLEGVLSNRTAAPDVSVAYNMTIGHYFARDRLNRDHFVEFTFWGLNGWKDRAEVCGSGNLYSRFAVDGDYLEGFDGVDLHTTYYASYTNSYELNGRIRPRGRDDQLVLHPNGKWRRECQPGAYISYLYGLRFFQENETFGFHGEGESSGTVYTGDYEVTSRNNLLGLQFGADLTFRQCRWSWGVQAKVGPYINFCDQKSLVTAGPAGSPTYTALIGATKHEASLIGETGFFATYKFAPNLMGRAGYDFMWVTGLALAPEQLQFTTAPADKINTNGTIFYHGVSLSMTWLW